MESIKMPEGCYWQKKNGVYSVYFSYQVISGDHEYLGTMTDMLGETYKVSDVTEIAERGREKKLAEFEHGH